MSTTLSLISFLLVSTISTIIFLKIHKTDKIYIPFLYLSFLVLNYFVTIVYIVSVNFLFYCNFTKNILMILPFELAFSILIPFLAHKAFELKQKNINTKNKNFFITPAMYIVFLISYLLFCLTKWSTDNFYFDIEAIVFTLNNKNTGSNLSVVDLGFYHCLPRTFYFCICF